MVWEGGDFGTVVIIYLINSQKIIWWGVEEGRGQKVELNPKPKKIQTLGASWYLKYTYIYNMVP